MAEHRAAEPHAEERALANRGILQRGANLPYDMRKSPACLPSSDAAASWRSRLPLIVVAVAFAAVGMTATLSGIGSTLEASYPVAPWLLRWVALPVFVVAASCALLAPGTLLVASRGRRPVGELILMGYGISFVILVVATSLAKAVGVVPAGRATLVAVLAAATFVGAVEYLRAASRGRAWVPDRTDGAALAVIAGIGPLIALMVFKRIFWQDLNGDGFEALEYARSLQWVILPRAPTASGFQGLGIGMLSVAWANHWWLLLMGAIEAAPRLSVTLHLSVAVAALGALVESGADRRLAAREWVAIAAAVAAWFLTLGFNDSYDPYFADLASPSGYEPLCAALLAGVVLFAWRRDWGWLALFGVLGALSRPTVVLVAGFVAVAMVLVQPGRWPDAARALGVVLAGFIVTYVGFERIAAPLLRESPVVGYGLDKLLERYQFLVIPGLQRLLWLLIPAGVLPWLSLVRWRAMDDFARVVALVSLAFAVSFIPLAFTNLHQFAFAMILPVVVLWRTGLRSGTVLATARTRHGRRDGCDCYRLAARRADRTRHALDRGGDRLPDRRRGPRLRRLSSRRHGPVRHPAGVPH